MSVLAETAGTHQATEKDDRESQIIPTVKLRSATYATAHNVSDANALKMMEEAGVRQCVRFKQVPTW
eukprot:6338502-Pyramimonas_sp.AAC.1